MFSRDRHPIWAQPFRQSLKPRADIVELIAGAAGESWIRLVIETRIAPECRAILK
jgi:hypothetical protein